MMSVCNELQAMGVVRKAIDKETDPHMPIYWSRHTWNFADTESDVIRLHMTKLTQNGREILHSSMPLGQIDALAGVPSFHPGITNEEAANLALYPPEILTYQRALIKERIPGIKDAWGAQNFCHTGTISLHIPPEHLESGAVTSHDGGNGTVIVEINLKRILLQCGDEYVDVDPGTGRDYRPLHVIDGQHRKVSCEDDIHLQRFPVFINILPLGTTYSEAAQLFTELNVTAEPLKPLHQLHQRYTCHIPHREATKDFGHPDEPDVQDSRRPYRRANRQAFHLAMTLATRPNPLMNRIQTMELPNRQLGRGCAVTSKKFIEFARGWFLDHRIFSTLDGMEAFRHFKAYLTAFRWATNHTQDEEITDHEGWALSHARGEDDPYITRPLPFEAVLGLFPQAYGYAKRADLDGEGQSWLDRFKEILKPLLAIHFEDFSTLKDHYGLDKQSPKALHEWFSWAIAHYNQTGVIHEADAVWNPVNPSRTDCQPGRGFFSQPDRSTIEGMIEWEDASLGAGSEMTLWLRPYPNTHLPPFLSIKYLDRKGEVLHSQSETGRSGDQQHSFMRHRISSAIRATTEIQVQIIVKNIHGEAQVQSSFKLEEFTSRDQPSLPIGKQWSIPEEWISSNEDVEEPKHEESNQTQDSHGLTQQGITTVVRAGDRCMTPPPKQNRLDEPTYRRPIVPRQARMVQCHLCSKGMECRHSNCVGKTTINGYLWG